MIFRKAQGRVPDPGPHFMETVEAYREAGRLDEAAPLLEQALSYYIQNFGPRDPDDHHPPQLSRRRLPGGLRVHHSIAQFEMALADTEQMLGAGDPDTLACRSNLAGVYQDAGDLGRATAMLEQALDDTRRLLGPDHDGTLTVQSNLATAYLDMEDRAGR